MAKQRKKPIDPAEYNRILSGLAIVRIDIDEFSGRAYDRERLRADDKPHVVELVEKSTFETGADDAVTVWHSYDLVVTDDDRSRLLSLAVKFRVRYESEAPFTPAFFEEFKKFSLRFQTAPFARAWIQDQCLRLGVPALILPLVHT